MTAAKGFDHVHVIDSGQISCGQGLVTLYAAKLAMEGKSPEEKEEIERAIYQEFGKSGNIIELFWGLEHSELLEKCNLIDTPGFNQNIDSKYIEKKRNIEALKSHYNQADGILWANLQLSAWAVFFYKGRTGIFCKNYQYKPCHVLRRALPHH